MLLKWLAIWGFLCFRFLIDRNMGGGGWNEVDVLPLARHFADPTWVAKDWYLNQPAGYRFLFQVLFGKIAAVWGFLAISLIGRAICYGLFALGFVLLGQKLKLSFSGLWLALFLFVSVGYYSEDWGQGVIANEWMIGGLEAKAVAYSLLPLIVRLILDKRYRLAVFLSGLATSFHVLVGGWIFLAIVGWLWCEWAKPTLRDCPPGSTKGDRKTQPQELGWILLCYLIGSIFAIRPVLDYLLIPTPTDAVSPSYIYVFLRLPHHLNPLSWKLWQWVKLGIFLSLLAASTATIRYYQRLNRCDRLTESYTACWEFAQFAWITLVPGALGILIAPFDERGQFLQYYPFRLGDVMLSLSTYVLGVRALQFVVGVKRQRLLQIIFPFIIAVACYFQATNFYGQVFALQEFPSKPQDVDEDWRDCSDWIRHHTPKDTVIISSPVEFTNFTWTTERATIAKFKLLPQTKTGIVNWYERLSDLSGQVSPWMNLKRTNDNRDIIRQRLSEGYDRLTTTQVVKLMNKYQASFFVTNNKHQLKLPIAYRNSSYILYRQPVSK
ncbi:MAG: hypothetical protein MUD14_05530 [Hydrococcus sp. Prado102]|nr:hypothetical protein [Hydrococcus sp. Prado102]